MIHKISNKFAAFVYSFRAMPLMYRAAPRDFIALLACATVSGLAPGIWIYLTNILINILANAHSDEAYAYVIVAMWLAAFSVPRILLPVMQWLQANLAEKFSAYVNIAIIEKSARLYGIAHYDRESYFSVLKILEDGAKSRPVNVVSILFALLRDTVSIVSICAAMLAIEWWFPLAFLLGLLPGIVASIHFREVSWNTLLSRSRSARVAEYLSTIAISKESSQEVRAHNFFPWLKQQYKQVVEDNYEKMRHVRARGSFGTIQVELVGIVGLALIAVAIVQKSASGSLSVAAITIVVQSLALGHTTLFYIVESLGTLFERGLFFKEFFTFMDMEDTIAIRNDPSSSEIRSLRFSNVSFKYRDGQDALRSVSFEIRAGEKIALVGENGCGKSTLIKMILRMYDPQDGRIEVNNQDIRDINVAKWRSMLSVVQQDIVRYALTIRDNVRISDTTNSDSDDSHVVEALASAGLDKYANEPALDMQLGRQFSGQELSGGEWQKMAIARALFRKAEFLIMDEPSASLDPKSESLFFSKLDEISKGKTTIFVTHRLGAIKYADRVLVMKEGEVVESGTHTQLLEQGGEYSRLWHAQAGQYDVMDCIDQVFT